MNLPTRSGCAAGEEPKAVTEEASKEPPKDDLPGVPDILKALEQQEAASAAAAGKPVEEKAATPPNLRTLQS